jgi:hypothetical protein
MDLLEFHASLQSFASANSIEDLTDLCRGHRQTGMSVRPLASMIVASAAGVMAVLEISGTPRFAPALLRTPEQARPEQQRDILMTIGLT